MKFTYKSVLCIWLIGFALIVTPVIIGCNSDYVAKTTAQIFQFDDEIELLEQGIVNGKAKLEGVPLTDMKRAEIEQQVKADEIDLTQKQNARGKLVKSRDAAEVVDDTMFADAAGLIRDVSPLGYSGFGLLGLSLLRGFLKNRGRDKADAGVVLSMQPFIDEATPEQIATVNEVQKKIKGAKAMVKKALKRVKKL